MNKKKLKEQLSNTVKELDILIQEYNELKALAYDDPKKALAIAEILKAQSNLLATKTRALKMFKEIEKLDVEIKEKKNKKEGENKAIQLKIEFTDLEANNEL